MGLLRKIIKKATRPIRAKRHGAVGERKVARKLNPLVFGKVEHRQINNLILVDNNGKSHQIDHIEIRENGIFVIETKNFIGWVFGSENSEKWTESLYTGKKYQVRNPIKQNKTHCYYVSKVIGPKYKVNSLIVMANDNADKIDCDNVINLKHLGRYLSNFDNGVHLTIEEMDYAYKKLISSASIMTNEEHIQNIRQTQREIKENICPRCGGKLILRTGYSGKFYGCSNYPKCKFTKKLTIFDLCRKIFS